MHRRCALIPGHKETCIRARRATTRVDTRRDRSDFVCENVQNTMVQDNDKPDLTLGQRGAQGRRFARPNAVSLRSSVVPRDAVGERRREKRRSGPINKQRLTLTIKSNMASDAKERAYVVTTDAPQGSLSISVSYNSEKMTSRELRIGQVQFCLTNAFINAKFGTTY